MDRFGAGCHPVPVTPLDDHSQQRQPLFFPVVIATALLTIIGMVGGYLLSQRAGDGGVSGADRDTAPTHGLLETSGDCLDQTQKMAAEAGAVGQLRQVVRVPTESGTVAWICQDDNGNLFYHANKGGDDAEWVEYKTALFLPGVSHDGAGEFSVTASNGTTFRVSEEFLVIEHASGRVEKQEAVPE
jgi:hypothetical protein